MRTPSIRARLGALGAAVALWLGMVSGLHVAEAATGNCSVEDLNSGVTGASLQGVIDSANAGDALQVSGVCVGKSAITKDLTIVGIPTQATPSATLDGGGWSVLRIRGVTTDVTLTDLTITNGDTKYAGGIYVQRASLILEG